MLFCRGAWTPGYTEYWLSKDLCLASQAAFTDISLNKFKLCISRPSFSSGVGKQKVRDRFDTGCGTLYMSIHVPSQLPVAKECCNILNANFWSSETEDNSTCFWCHKSSGLWWGHCVGATLGRRGSDPTFRYHGAQPSRHRPCTPHHAP